MSLEGMAVVMWEIVLAIGLIATVMLVGWSLCIAAKKEPRE